jgi:hypothetical protein
VLPERCDTVLTVPTALLHGLPVLLVIALIALVYKRGRKNQVSYTLSQPFTHEPILWAATDETIPGGGHGHGHGGSALNVGGGASGRW